MRIESESVTDYVSKIPEERRPYFEKLRDTINKNIPKGFSEELNYGMPGWVVPHSIYPAGYHCSPELPLPFVGIASQKNFIAFYHMGIYANEELLKWFVAEYPKHCARKLDMGKSCVRFKKPGEIPFDLIGQLMQKMTPQDWIELYEKNYKR